MRWCVFTRSAQAVSSPVVHRSKRAASAVSTSDHPIAPAFFTNPPETGVPISLAPSSEPLDPDCARWFLCPATHCLATPNPQILRYTHPLTQLLWPRESAHRGGGR